MRKPEFETTNEDWRGMEIWLIYGALLRTPNYGDKLNYAIPYGKANRETHPRCAWVNELSRRYAAGRENAT